MTAFLSPEAAESIRKRKPYGIAQDPFTVGYHTKGGSYMIASNGRQNDRPGLVDLAIILPIGTVLALRPTVNPDFIAAIEAAIQEED